ncbi:MAG: RnfH family protein [Methylotetracoccus sp.]
MNIEVVYALPDEQSVVRLELPEPARVRDAIEGSGLLERHPQIDLTRQSVGVFGRICELDETIKDGDRVEIYRPLRIDPKEQRRARAAAGPQRGKQANAR